MEPPGMRAGAMRNYAVTHMVGEGSFGRVYKARKRGTGETVALKRIAKAGRSEKEISSLRQEIDILSRLTHPNIVQMVELVETTSELCVITEFAHGELFEVIEDDQCLPEPEVQTIAQQLTRALHYLHSNSIIHRDMKPQNILIGTNKRVMLCDFGFARAMSSTTIVLTSIKGTPLYMAPELVQEKPYDLTVDLWSLGVILYELYMGKPPFYTNNIYGLIQHIIKDHIHFPTSVSNAFKSFLQGLLMKKPSERLTWPDLLHHQFVHLEGSVTEPTPPRLVAQPHTSYPTSSPAPSTVVRATALTLSLGSTVQLIVLFLHILFFPGYLNTGDSVQAE
jgi:fused-like protein